MDARKLYLTTRRLPPQKSFIQICKLFKLICLKPVNPLKRSTLTGLKETTGPELLREAGSTEYFYQRITFWIFRIRFCMNLIFLMVWSGKLNFGGPQPLICLPCRPGLIILLFHRMRTIKSMKQMKMIIIW